MSAIFDQILQQRGLDENFLHPKYEDLFDPFLMRDMQKAVERIELARDKDEHILIYGDYDVDGITSSSVLATALKDFGCKYVEIILPNRFTDGYGMKDSAIEKIVAMGTNLVITVDNGSSSGATIEKLLEYGIDTIVTDHHEIPNIPEKAIAVINPKRADEKQGSYMAGVGVAFTLARALNMRQNGGVCNGQEKWLLDLVTLGTICDSMELRGENRIFSYYGMKVFPKTRRRGLKALAAKAKVDLEKIDSQAIGFHLGPRLNAGGRMKSADLSLNLLLAEGKAEALNLADELDGLNNERRSAQDNAVKDAILQFDENDPVIVVSGKWHEGIVGIVAGKMVEKFHKPAIVLSRLEDGVLKGSGRSFGDFSLAEALQKLPDGLLLSGGGHAAACGLSLSESDLDAFKANICKYYSSLKLKDQERYLKQASDIVLEGFAPLDVDLYDEIHLLEPFGMGNEEPIFETKARVKDVKVLKDVHLALTLEDASGETMRMMSFYAPDEWLNMNRGAEVTAQWTLMKNEWRGDVKIEGLLVSLETLG